MKTGRVIARAAASRPIRIRYLYKLPISSVSMQYVLVTEAECPDGWVGHEDTCYHFSHDTESVPGAKVCFTMSFWRWKSTSGTSQVLCN